MDGGSAADGRSPASGGDPSADAVRDLAGLVPLAPGTRVHGTITGIVDYGAFLVTDDGRRGLIHISEISDWYVERAEDYFYKGERVQVEVVHFDPNSGKYAFSTRRLGGKQPLANRYADRLLELHRHSVTSPRYRHGQGWNRRPRPGRTGRPGPAAGTMGIAPGAGTPVHRGTPGRLGDARPAGPAPGGETGAATGGGSGTRGTGAGRLPGPGTGRSTGGPRGTGTDRYRGGFRSGGALWTAGSSPDTAGRHPGGHLHPGGRQPDGVQPSPAGGSGAAGQAGPAVPAEDPGARDSGTGHRSAAPVRPGQGPVVVRGDLLAVAEGGAGAAAGRGGYGDGDAYGKSGAYGDILGAALGGGREARDALLRLLRHHVGQVSPAARTELDRLVETYGSERVATALARVLEETDRALQVVEATGRRLAGGGGASD